MIKMGKHPLRRQQEDCNGSRWGRYAAAWCQPIFSSPGGSVIDASKVVSLLVAAVNGASDTNFILLLGNGTGKGQFIENTASPYHRYMTNGLNIT